MNVSLHIRSYMLYCRVINNIKPVLLNEILHVYLCMKCYSMCTPAYAQFIYIFFTIYTY